MTKANALSRLIGIVLLVFSAILSAQQPATVGDLFDKGGKKLTKEELSTLLTGAIISGTQAGTGAKYNNTHNADGSVRGNAMRASGQVVGVFGKWNVNDQGQYCWDLSTGPGSKMEGCVFYFALDNAYYASSSDERTATLSVREVKTR